VKVRLLLVIATAILVPTVAAAAAKPLQISLPPGWSAHQMADRVSAVRQIAIHKDHVTPVLTGTAYATAAAKASPPALFAAADKRRSIEGFLFPDRYEFDPTETSQTLVAEQIQTFAGHWAKIGLAQRAKNVGPYGVLTIASMVEREAVVPSERPLIAAVIYNRLDKGMPLGIDATIRYGLGIQGTRPLTSAELKNPSPYNTDLHTGLPPTPIGNPGLASLQAAADPADVDYLYYVRKPNSQHHFFTDDETVFCQKSLAWGYGGC
jgi:UPF0755 protein